MKKTAKQAARWRREGPVPVILDLLLLLTLLALPLIWLLDPLKLTLGPWRMSASWGPKPLLFLALLFLVRRLAVRGPAGLLPRTPVKLLLLAVYPAWILLLLAEGVLAIAGFSRPPPPIVIQGEFSRASPIRYSAFAGDAELGWVLNPGASFQGRTVNRLGFFDREVGERKPEGGRRVICMGDSCTAQGAPPYSGYLHEMLRADPVTPESWEAFNTGVHGYSSHQGLKLYRRRVRDMGADVVTVFFGWNDHWTADRTDAARAGRICGPVLGKLLNALHRKRFYSFMVRILRGEREADGGEGPGVRVTPEEYVRNLSTLINEIRADGAVPVLITAPRTDRLAGKIVHNNRPRPLEELLAAHDRYAELTRRVAEEKNAELLDLAALLAGPDSAGLFLGDGVHFRQGGLQRIAAEIHRHLRSMAGRGEL